MAVTAKQVQVLYKALHVGVVVCLILEVMLGKVEEDMAERESSGRNLLPPGKPTEDEWAEAHLTNFFPSSETSESHSSSRRLVELVPC